MEKDSNENTLEKISKGPSLGFTDNFPKRQMWKELAKEFKGEYKIKHSSGYGLEIHHVSIPYKKWNIEITVSDTQPLKFQMSFSSLQNFELTISWDDFIERIFKIFNKSDVKLGWKKFDKHYLIRTNRSDFVKNIFCNEVQKKMLKHDVYSISYQTDPKNKKAKLLSVIQRRAGTKEMNIEIIEMFKKIIDKLEKLKIII